MLNLPKTTEINRTIFKNKIYRKFKDQLKGQKKEIFDREISKLVITNQLSEESINIPGKDGINYITFLKVELKTRDFTQANIAQISKLFGQNLIFILNYEDHYKLGVYRGRLFTTEWKKLEDLELKIQGLNIQSVWDNLLVQIGNIEVEQDNTIEEQIEIDEKKEKLKRLIDSTRKKMGRETQAKKKRELFKEIKDYEKELENYNG